MRKGTALSISVWKDLLTEIYQLDDSLINRAGLESLIDQSGSIRELVNELYEDQLERSDFLVFLDQIELLDAVMGLVRCRDQKKIDQVMRLFVRWYRNSLGNNPDTERAWKDLERFRRPYELQMILEN